MKDLKKCDLVSDWHDTVHAWEGAWRVFVKDGGAELKFFLKRMRRTQDGLKQKRDGNGPSLQSQLSILCSTEPNCDYVGQSNAGRVNHIRKWHGVVVQEPKLLPSLWWPIQEVGTIQKYIRLCQGSSTWQHWTQYTTSRLQIQVACITSLVKFVVIGILLYARVFPIGYVTLLVMLLLLHLATWTYIYQFSMYACVDRKITLGTSCHYCLIVL